MEKKEVIVDYDGNSPYIAVLVNSKCVYRKNIQYRTAKKAVQMGCVEYFRNVLLNPKNSTSFKAGEFYKGYDAEKIRILFFNMDKISEKAEIKALDTALTQKTWKKTILNHIEEIRKGNYTAVAFLRKSTSDAQKNSVIKYKERARTIKTFRLLQNERVYTLYVDDFSGYYAPSLISTLFKQCPSLKIVATDDYDRLSRNLVDFLVLTRDCYRSHKKLIVGDKVVNFGTPLLISMLMVYFANKELTGKQTSFGYSSLEFLKWKLELVKFDDVSEKTKKLIDISQFMEDIDSFVFYLAEKAEIVINSNKSDKLKNEAKEFLDLFHEYLTKNNLS